MTMVLSVIVPICLRYASLIAAIRRMNCERNLFSSVVLTLSPAAWRQYFDTCATVLRAGVIGVVLTGCGAADYATVSGATMGTYYSVTYRAEGDCQIVQTAIDARLNEINAVMSTYQADSELSQFNDSLSLSERPVSAELSAVLQTARQVHEETGGAFDVTVGPLVNLWGFGPERVTDAPSPAALEAVAEQIGMDKLHLTETGISKGVSGLYVDLSALAKGYAVDQIAAGMLARGCSDFMVDIGGEIRVAGRSSRGGPWRVGVEVPEAGHYGELQNVLQLTDASVATSGDYRNFRIVEGVRVDHVIDPRIAAPADNGVASATVVHERAMLADAYATAVMVLGEDAGLALADNLGFAVYVLISEPSDSGNQGDEGGFRVRYNDSMMRYLAELP